jgi:hypothetical protein
VCVCVCVCLCACEGGCSEALKASHRKLSLQYHPDKNSDPHAPVLYAAMQHAYETLAHPVRRPVYELMGHAVLSACAHCATYHDYVVAALPMVGVRAAVEVGISLLLHYLGGSLHVAYWSLLWQLALSTVHLHAIRTCGAERG